MGKRRPLAGRSRSSSLDRDKAVCRLLMLSYLGDVNIPYPCALVRARWRVQIVDTNRFGITGLEDLNVLVHSAGAKVPPSVHRCLLSRLILICKRKNDYRMERISNAQQRQRSRRVETRMATIPEMWYKSDVCVSRIVPQVCVPHWFEIEADT